MHVWKDAVTNAVGGIPVEEDSERMWLGDVPNELVEVEMFGSRPKDTKLMKTMCWLQTHLLKTYFHVRIF